jgi:very-short-patch-repair endonuclease
LWPAARLIVELDGFAFHRHRGAFERDRARDTALMVAGYLVVRITYRRLVKERDAIAREIHKLLRRSRA